MTAYRSSSFDAARQRRQISFKFDGKTYYGLEGDTLASALLANGVRVVGRSFKYHRRRGLVAAGYDEPNAIVQVGSNSATVPNLKATAVELTEGLDVRSVNAWPSLRFDLLSVNALFKRFMPAGFYYKTFTWPDWHLFEPWIRKAAGLGHSPQEPDEDVYTKKSAKCDILIVGGGIAGICAADIAARSGAKVLLVEADRDCGGIARTWPIEVDGVDGVDWCKTQVTQLNALENVTVLKRTMAFGYYDHNLIGLLETPPSSINPDGQKPPRQRLWKVRARKVILATGALERPLVFPNNDRPGVMLANAGARYARDFGVIPGREIVVATNNDSAYESAFSVVEMGGNVKALVDTREDVPSHLLNRLKEHKIEFISNAMVTDALGGTGVKSAEICNLSDNGQPNSSTRRKVRCDCVLMSGGWSPVVHLHSQSGGKLEFDESEQAFLPSRSVQPSISVGAAANLEGMRASIDQLNQKVVEAVSSLGLEATPIDVDLIDDAEQGAVQAFWSVDMDYLGRPSAKAWLDFQNDVTSSDVKLAIRENFRSVEHVKRYTTLGMASDQGKTSNVNGIGVMSQVMGKPLTQIGTTKFRPPYNPITIGAFAGRRVGENLLPLRDLPSKAALLKLGAKLEDYGGWRRPAFFSPNGESEDAAITREVNATRNSVGIFDASPLGKIEVFGPDAREFLNRIYVNNMSTLKPGRCRYGLMLDENGVVFDDGILACLADDHFLVGTTSGHAATIAGILQEWLQCEWVDLDVATSDVTTNWAVVNLNGPNARDLINQFDTDISFDSDAFPHMHYRSGTFEGVSCRVQRVSFSGELSYEISVPWSYGQSLFDLFLERGQDYDIQPFGLEALMTMRIEKGFLHVGSDTDGMTLPQDVGFGRIMEKKKADFVGRRSAIRPDGLRSDRRQLVGLEVIDQGEILPVGGHIVESGASPPIKSQGWVSSSAYSPTLSKPVALALLENGQARMGEEIEVWDLGNRRSAKVIQPGVFDPKGEKLSG